MIFDGVLSNPLIKLMRLIKNMTKKDYSFDFYETKMIDKRNIDPESLKPEDREFATKYQISLNIDQYFNTKCLEMIMIMKKFDQKNDLSNYITSTGSIKKIEVLNKILIEADYKGVINRSPRISKPSKSDRKMIILSMAMDMKLSRSNLVMIMKIDKIAEKDKENDQIRSLLLSKKQSDSQKKIINKLYPITK